MLAPTEMFVRTNDVESTQNDTSLDDRTMKNRVGTMTTLLWRIDGLAFAIGGMAGNP
jgi:hypothetical protein